MSIRYLTAIADMLDTLKLGQPRLLLNQGNKSDRWCGNRIVKVVRLNISEDYLLARISREKTGLEGRFTLALGFQIA